MSHPSFASLSPKPDPIFAIASKAKAAEAQAIDGILGVYIDGDGKAKSSSFSPTTAGSILNVE
jgi:hypothetical protein